MNIAGILNKIANFIKNLFSKVSVEIRQAIEIAVIVTENLKTFVDSPGADALTVLIPGTVDDKLKNWLRQVLPAILVKLKLAQHNEENVVAKAVAELNAMDQQVKSAYLHSISVLCAREVSKNRLSWSDGVYLLEWYYKNKYQRK